MSANATGSKSIDDGQIAQCEKEALAPFEREEGPNPFSVHEDLMNQMQKYVGIMRTEEDLTQGLKELERLRDAASRVKVMGPRHYNASWHETIDLRNLLVVSEAIARAGLLRKESRGAHARADFPDMDKGHWSKINIVSRERGGQMQLEEVALPPLPDEIKKVLEEDG
jgi:succinate dehydrogenase / fumarate reductase flavoprotein subunit